jgi:hypothetical protein
MICLSTCTSMRNQSGPSPRQRHMSKSWLFAPAFCLMIWSGAVSAQPNTQTTMKEATMKDAPWNSAPTQRGWALSPFESPADVRPIQSAEPFARRRSYGRRRNNLTIPELIGGMMIVGLAKLVSKLASERRKEQRNSRLSRASEPIAARSSTTATKTRSPQVLLPLPAETKSTETPDEDLGAI